MTIESAIARSNGYELYHTKGVPYVIRKWSTSIRDGNGVKVTTKHEARMDLREESFPDGPRATDAYRELMMTWKEWLSWNTAKRK